METDRPSKKCICCSFENTSDAKFCQNCGEPLALTCNSCGTDNVPEATFCKICGHHLERPPSPDQETKLRSLQQAAPRVLQEKMRTAGSQIEGGRRPVTIFFADIVGSTAIAEKLDPEEWKEVVSGAHRRVSEAIYRYEGTIAQLLGDGVLAFFGAPITHEDDPIRAVHAALDIQESIGEYGHELAGYVEDFQVRIGINTGTVVIGEIGTDLHMEYLAIGDAVNVAARLQSVAEPGKVLLSEACARLVGDAFELKSLGEIQVKGKTEPLAAYQVVEARAPTAVRRGIEGLQAPYIGREQEVVQLQSVLLSLCEGFGQVVALVGEAGIGKTRMLEEVKALVCEGEGDPETTPISPESIHWLEGRSLSYGGSLSYWAITQLLLADLGLSDGAPLVKIKVALHRRVKDLFGEEKSDGVLPYLSHLLGLKQEGEAEELIQSLDGETLKRGMMRSLQDFFVQVAKERPSALVFEDMHWIDPSSLETLGGLLALTDRVPLMILMLMRIERDHGSWGVKIKAETDLPHRYTEIHLRRLSEADSSELIVHLLGEAELPEELQSMIMARSVGNPFYLEEVTRHLIEGGLIVWNEGGWHAAEAIGEIGIPDTLHGVLLARIDRLEEDVRQTLQMASVIGKSFLYRILEAISEAEQQLDEHLTQLQRVDLVREKARIPELEYMFKHTLTQEATYNSLLHDRRKEFHQRVGEALEELFPDRGEEFLGLLAHHFEAAEANEKAGDYLIRAGDKSYDEAALEEMIEYYKRALKIYMMLGDQIKIGDVEVRLGWAQWARGDRRTSLEHIHRAFSILEEKGETKELAWVIYNISRMHMMASEYDQAIAWGERALALAERLDAEETIVHTLNTVGVSRILKGDMEKGLAELKESLRLSLVLDHKDAVSRAYYNLGEVLTITGRYAEARANYEAYHKHALRFSSRVDKAMALLNLSFLDWLCGRWAVSLDRIPEIKEGVVIVWGNVVAHYIFGMMDNDLGQSEKACMELERMLSSALSTGEIQTTGPYLGQLARAYAALGRESESARTIQQYIDLIDSNPYFEMTSVRLLLFCCQWFAVQTDTVSLEKCRASVDRLERAYEQLHFPETKATLEEGKGCLALAEGQPTQAAKHFRHAVNTWEALGRPYDKARVLGGLGRALVMASDLGAARLAYDQSNQLLEMLADQLDDEARSSFMASQLVDMINEERASLERSK